MYSGHPGLCVCVALKERPNVTSTYPLLTYGITFFGYLGLNLSKNFHETRK